MGLLPGDHNFRAYTRMSTKEKKKSKRGKRDRIVYESEGVDGRELPKGKEVVTCSSSWIIAGR
jgi:hypothetical protein